MSISLAEMPSSTKHVCTESIPFCRCYMFALEPSENCPIHGGGFYPPRCSECGKFMKVKELFHPIDVSILGGDPSL